MERKTKHLIVLSLDALGSIDFQHLIKEPHTKKILENASFCKNVQSIYPSLTYPAHTSIITGCYPKKHGVINNTFLQPNRKSPDWFWHACEIKVPTLIDYALKQQMQVAALLWPVTGKSKLQYNVPEIFANRPWQHQIPVSLCNGSPKLLLKLNQLFGHLRKGKEQPYLDNFTHACAKYVLQTYKPDVTLVHYTDLDTQKHLYGSNSPQRLAAIKRLDERIGDIVQLLQSENIEQSSTLILLGDHSQLDTQKIIYLNSILAQEGLLTEKNGKITDWQVISKSCDGSAYIYLKDKNNKQLVQKTYNLLAKLAENPVNGIRYIFTSQEASELGADPTCTWMLEASIGYYFLNEVKEKLIYPIRHKTSPAYTHSLVATHGYLPTLKNYQTVFIASGAGIKKNVEIRRMSLIDEGPTFAKLLGLQMKDVDGRILEEILE